MLPDLVLVSLALLADVKAGVSLALLTDVNGGVPLALLIVFTDGELSDFLLLGLVILTRFDNIALVEFGFLCGRLLVDVLGFDSPLLSFP